MDLRPFMERWGMLPPSGGTMLVAVSGGRDSVCLLHYLATMPRDFSVAAAHLDHGQRPTAGRDVAFVRQLCREVHLSVWNKPAYACLATRIPTGTPITRAALWSIEQGENLLSSLGFQNFRIRLHGGAAVLQVQEDQFSYACENREAILARLSPVFSLVTLDLVPRRRGE